MRGNDVDEWSEKNLCSGGFKGILERVANQFTPNHNSQYQPGFIPANSPHLSQQAPSQEINHGRLLDTMGAESIFSTRNFPIVQEPFVSAHSSIIRASSDLGARLANFSQDDYSGIEGPNQNAVENIDGSIYYPKKMPSLFPNSYSNNAISSNYGQKPGDMLPTQQLNSGYMLSSSHIQTTSSSFSPNVMAPIGTWKDTYVQNTSLYEDNDNIYGTGFGDRNGQDRASNLVPQSCLINPDPGVPIDRNIDEHVKKSNLKPSYSDVLSKAPSVNKHNHLNFELKNMAQGSNFGGSLYSHRGKKDGNSKHSFSHGKQRNRNVLNSANNNSSSTNLKSKICHDSFEPIQITQFGVEPNISDKRAVDAECTSKYSRKTDNQSQPSPLQLRKTRDKRMGHDVDAAPSVTKDQLNNQAISSQRKQTPKRTSFINNVRSSTPPSVPLKRNNSEPFTKSFKPTDDIGLYEDSLATDNRKNNNNNENSSNVAENIFNKDGGPGVRTRKAKAPRATEVKKNVTKRKHEPCPTNYEQIIGHWLLLKVWLVYALGLAVWLFGIWIDVIQISYGLSIRFGKEFLEKGNSKSLELMTTMAQYWKSVKNYFAQKTRKGRSDKKKAGGLDNNIPLPSTGEAAMKRLLACRGKDPYNILGVTRTCSDEDIKKYYKRQAFMVHPDKNKQPGAEESFKILAHAFELIGESQRRAKYDNRLNAEAQLESECSEMSSLLTRLKEKLDESTNTIRCTNCNQRHKRTKQARPVYGARYCGDCRICHGAREGDIWAESYLFGIRWKYYACMEGAIYDITEWASCQKENLKQLQANLHSVQYRIVSGKKTSNNKSSYSEGQPEPELEDFFNNYCRDRYSQGGQQTQSENRKKRGKRKK